MLHLKILKAETAAEVGRLAADQFQEVMAAKPACVLGLATGSTPVPLYRELAAREKAGYRGTGVEPVARPSTQAGLAAMTS